MAQTSITDGMGGLDARDAINGNFAELYANLNLPLKIAGMTGNTNQAIAANSMVTQIFVSPVSGGPVTLRIGLTANGQEILPDTAITDVQAIKADEYFGNAGILYFTYTSGTGNLNVRIDYIANYN